MREVSFTGTVIHSARTAGGGAGLPVTAGSSNRGTCLFSAEPSGGHAAAHYPDRHATNRRPTPRTPCRQEREQEPTASTLYGSRKMQYGQHA